MKLWWLPPCHEPLLSEKLTSQRMLIRNVCLDTVAVISAPGQHKMLVELVDANHLVFAECAECRQTVTFTVPETTSRPH